MKIHSMKSISVALSLALVVLMISGCAAPTPLPLTATPSATPTPTITPTPAPTYTPTPTPPPVDHGLRPENAATQTYENGIWTVKNADGQVTATWNEETSEWTYDMETIKIQRILAGWHDNDLTPYKEILERPLPPDDPSTRFIDPGTGKPMEYGSWKEGSVEMSGYLIGDFIQPLTYISVRIRGGVEVDGVVSMLLSVPTGVDSESVIAIPVPNSDTIHYGFAEMSDDDLAGNDLMKFIVENAKAVSYDSFVPFLNEQAFGKQAFIVAWHDMPLNLRESYPTSQAELNTMRNKFIEFLNGGSKPPFIVDVLGQQPFIHRYFALLQEETEPIN